MPTTDSRWKEKYSRLLDEYERLERNTTQRAQLHEQGLRENTDGVVTRDRHISPLKAGLIGAAAAVLAIGGVLAAAIGFGWFG